MSYPIEIIRHSLAHVMAAAVKKLYPDAKFAGGPSVENGFYYDFECSHKFTPEDFPRIEKEMRELIKGAGRFEKRELSVAEAQELFAAEPYKLEWIADLAAKGEALYAYTFRGFSDLCRGPHVESSKELPRDGFALARVAGAYWKGDAANNMLQRLYAYAFASKEELEAYQTMLAEAEKRDHRKLGVAQDLFHLEPEFAPGGVFWHPKGWGLFNRLIEYMRARQAADNYLEISTPSVNSRKMFELSGHWSMYAQHMYYARVNDEDGEFAVKPVSCPGGMLVFRQGIKSYRDLPMKVAEFGKVDRYESSGSLMGLMRVREFTQDDAHIFCTEEQVEAECIKVIEFILSVYRDFGFDTAKIKIKLSTRPEVRLGTDEVWDASEAALANALRGGGYSYELFPGEGAIYGPKLEFVLADAIGREWQCGTLQFDMNLPERFDITYIDANSEKRRPIMLHRALFGSLERFLGILIEHCAGRFPFWLAPVQAVVIPISEKAHDYAERVAAELGREFRVEKMYSSDSMQKRIREAQLAQIPYMIILGEAEAAAGVVSVRTRAGEQLNNLPLADFVADMRAKVAARASDI